MCIRDRPTSLDGSHSRDHAGGARHGPGLGVDNEAVLGETTSRCDRGLDLGHDLRPASVVATMRPVKGGGQIAAFGTACAGCPLASACTNAKDGRRIRIGIYEAELVRARTTQADPAWRAEYRATRPKVERKIGHLMRRRHGGRRARVRGQTKVAADFSLLAAAVDLARFGILGLTRVPGPRWVLAPI